MTGTARLGVGVIGAGRVGPVIGAALAGAGHALLGITPGSDPDRVSAILGDVPVLTADEVVRRSELVVIAVPHDEVAGLWYVGDRAGLAGVEQAAGGNLKPVWSPAHRDWTGVQAQGREFLRQATQTKTIWLPYGALPAGTGSAAY